MGRDYGVTHGPPAISEEAIRRRNNGANRMFIVLKATLDMAVREGKASRDVASRAALPRGSRAADPLSRPTAMPRLIAAAADDLRMLVLAALYTRARISEPRPLLVGDADFDELLRERFPPIVASAEAAPVYIR